MKMRLFQRVKELLRVRMNTQEDLQDQHHLKYYHQFSRRIRMRKIKRSTRHFLLDLKELLLASFPKYDRI